MKSMLKKMVAALTAGWMLVPCAALADAISFEGTVVARETKPIYAPIGGTVDSVAAEVGQSVEAGDVLATLKTTKVYAEEAGTVTGLFGEPGDSAQTVAQRYGAVLYIEGESVYTLSASTEKAYDATENKFVRVGEEVRLSCYSDGAHTGTGVITAIAGTDYTVEVLSGEFLVGETVNVYRGEVKSANRIGRGTLTRKDPTAVTGTGSIVSFAVSNGDAVARGDLLFETLDGEFDGLYMSGREILAECDGTIAEVNLTAGGKVEKGSVAASVYPKDAMRIEAQVEEANLGSIAVGDPVSIELVWNQDEEVTYSGVVVMISGVANAADGQEGASGEVTYNVYIDFVGDENTRYGMSAVVNTLDGDAMGEEDADEQA